MSKLGGGLLLIASLGVSAEGRSAATLHTEFPKAGQQMLGAEVQPKEVPTPGFAALLFIQEAKIFLLGHGVGQAGALSREMLVVGAATWETGDLRCWPASFRGDVNQ